MKQPYVFLAGLVILLIIDIIWLGVISRNFYAKELGSLMKDKVNFISAILVYILLFIGIFFFVLNSPYATTPLNAALVGALFGLIVYGVYDLTNLAIIKGYALKLTIVDMIWGTILGGLMGSITKLLSSV